MREAGDSWSKCAKALGRSTKSVQVDWARRHPTTARNFKWWTKAEDALLIRLWGEPIAVISDALGRSIESIHNRACALRRLGKLTVGKRAAECYLLSSSRTSPAIAEPVRPGL